MSIISIDNFNPNLNLCTVKFADEDSSYAGSFQSETMLAFYQEESLLKLSAKDLKDKKMTKENKHFCKKMSFIGGKCGVHYLTQNQKIAFKTGSIVQVLFNMKHNKAKPYNAKIDYIMRRDKDGTFFLSVKCLKQNKEDEVNEKENYLISLESLNGVVRY